MAAIITVPAVFRVNRELRAFAAKHHIPTTRINDGCRAALREISNGRSEIVAQLAGEKAMRVEAVAPQAGLIA